MMDVFCEETYRVDSRDLDLFGHCRPSALLGYLQEAATQAACLLHVSREETIERYHAFWMLARIRYDLLRPLRWDEPVTVKTWHRGGRAAMMYREFDLTVGEEKVGQALSAWVLADLDTHKLFHPVSYTHLVRCGDGTSPLPRGGEAGQDHHRPHEGGHRHVPAGLPLR